jgi:hypothetical protein
VVPTLPEYAIAVKHLFERFAPAADWREEILPIVTSGYTK